MPVGWELQEQGKLWELLWVGGKAVVQREATAPPELWGAVVAQCPSPAVCVCCPSTAPAWDTLPPCRAGQAPGLGEPLTGWALQETSSFLMVSITKGFSVSPECPQLASHPLPSNPASLGDVRVCRSLGWAGRRDPRNG